ncbi:facilitated trehalose transporter Tret1-like [Bombus vosnesenskii]|uniref:Facilitated trehalose transporter Tret1-like n=1 Tax=Bombus vosnesenskii TaxID=207650 RepID=A0A6J3LM56_9HYME|nr:facilitated trehalose transporter Tret1-like [Bombus vosnesenskii]
MDLTKYTWLEKLRAILQRSNRRALFIVLGLIISQHLSGIFTATQYLEDIISRNASIILGYSDMICLEIVRLLSNYIFALIVDSCGRRKLLIMSATGTIYISFLLTFYFYSPKHSSIDFAMSFIPISHFLLYQVVFHIGLGVLPNVFLCDLFPTKLKGIVGAIVVIFDGIIGFTASKLTQVITDNIGVFENYAFFWISCLIALVMMLVWVPETGGKTYREIEELLLGENFNFLNEEISTNEMDIRRI